VCLEDLLPTFLELAGLPTPRPMDGVSLVATLRGSPARLRATLHVEHAVTYGPDQAFHALTDGRHKYIWRPADGTEQLFDLERDPREEHNLATSSSAATSPAVTEWRTRLIRTLSDRPEGFTDGQRLITGRPYRAVQTRPAVSTPR
jgi:arylsulfatase